ncbi:hypothetical protein ACFQ7W_13785 [Streptomyces niveus]|uniref:AbiJ-related protein n=1 Tax=Streptomyces niveus TaxID=193462 RepID=UPI0036AC3EAA
MRLLGRFWITGGLEPSLGDLLNGMRRVTLGDLVERHVFRNPGDWSAEELFDQLGAFEAGDARFARFLEGLVSADVLLDEDLQRRTAGTVNSHLRPAGVELRQTGDDGGYPLFTLVPTRLHAGRRPKNIIFATRTKPDIRFLSSVDNDIEIVADNPDDISSTTGRSPPTACAGVTCTPGGRTPATSAARLRPGRICTSAS